MNFVPEQGKRIKVKSVVNQNRYDENESVRKQVHPDNIKLGAEVARELNIHLAGVDFMTPDISRPLHEVGGIINELNTTPGIHHHYLIKNADEGVAVACILLEYLLKSESIHAVDVYF